MTITARSRVMPREGTLIDRRVGIRQTPNQVVGRCGYRDQDGAGMNSAGASSSTSHRRPWCQVTSCAAFLA